MKLVFRCGLGSEDTAIGQIPRAGNVVIEDLALLLHALDRAGAAWRCLLLLCWFYIVDREVYFWREKGFSSAEGV